MSVNFDLFGQPVRDGYGKRGRPPYEPNDRDRNKIKLLLALGWTLTKIANALCVSPATVKRYFRAELKERDAMRDRLDARRFEIAMEQANAGNVAALKELSKMIERSDLMLVDLRLRAAHEGNTPDKEEKVGKKEAARQAAKTAGEGSDWGSDLLPGVGMH